jgi:hypothetical protein
VVEDHRRPTQARRDNWVTVAVTALGPGWRRVHRLADGTVEVHPIPAVLLQELRSTTHLRASTKPDTGGVEKDDTQDDHEPPPYGTRVVVAQLDERLELIPAVGDDLLGVAGPAEDVAVRFPAKPSPVRAAQ